MGRILGMAHFPGIDIICAGGGAWLILQPKNVFGNFIFQKLAANSLSRCVFDHKPWTHARSFLFALHAFQGALFSFVFVMITMSRENELIKASNSATRNWASQLWLASWGSFLKNRPTRLFWYQTNARLFVRVKKRRPTRPCISQYIRVKKEDRWMLSCSETGSTVVICSVGGRSLETTTTTTSKPSSIEVCALSDSLASEWVWNNLNKLPFSHIRSTPTYAFTKSVGRRILCSSEMYIYTLCGSLIWKRSVGTLCVCASKSFCAYVCGPARVIGVRGKIFFSLSRSRSFIFFGALAVKKREGKNEISTIYCALLLL